MKEHTYSSTLLAVSSVILMAVGLYFTFLRPALLPEDLRYMSTSLAEIQAEIPGLLQWLPKVFWVLGGYIFTTGLLTLYIARTTFRTGKQQPSAALAILAVAGLSSIGGMVIVNVLIDSAFTWPLAGIAVLWASALALSWIEGRQRQRDIYRLRGAPLVGNAFGTGKETVP
jgi:hypothetical protein